jgi:hypothetical protein
MKLVVFAFILLMLSGCTRNLQGDDQTAPFDWKSDWALREGFSIRIDTEGYEFPTAIAFIPNPGTDPKDPLYFVTELRGKLKVVTNDRTVLTFAERFFQLTPSKELPSSEGEVGLAGLCLDPERGYVFVTFSYLDQNKVLRNNIIRFQSIPKVFSLKPTSLVSFADVFSADISAPSHQIGPCQVQGGQLFVGVGDAKLPHRSQDLQSTLGKILRMTLDGKPVSDNPFYRGSNVRNSRNHVWAYGLRNPFSLRIVKERLFLFDNGPRVDRFVQVARGENYLWDGSDWSVGTNAAFVLAPSVGPVQMDYFAGGVPNFPQEYAGHFFVAISADVENPLKREKPGILMLEYDFDRKRIISVPSYFLEYRGESVQMVVGVGFGADGLYVVPLYPNRRGKTLILRVTYDPPGGHPFVLGRDEDPVSLMRDRGCFGCHALSGVGGTGAPPLDGIDLVARLQKRLHSKEYVESVKELDRLETEPYRSFREARRKVLEARGLERVRIWTRHQIQAPGFDNPFSQMPNLQIPEREALNITDYLLEEAKKGRFAVTRLLPRPRYRHMLFALLAGGVCGFLLFPLWLRLRKQRFRT